VNESTFVKFIFVKVADAAMLLLFLV